MADLRSRSSTLGVLSMSQVVDKLFEQRADSTFQPVRFGFGSLDREIRGVAMGQVAGIAGRAGTGKTSLEATIVNLLAGRNDCGILVCSMEMPDVEWACKAAAIHANVTPDDVEDWVEKKDRASFADLEQRQTNVRITGRPLKLDEIPDAIAEANETLKTRVRVVVIDYMGLIGAPGKDTYERVSTVARGLKILAKREEVAVFIAIQLSRAAGDGSIPVSLDMMRDSGAIEESADYILGCWRPGNAQNLDPVQRDQLRELLKVKVLKNRKGPAGALVDLRFLPSRRLYEEARPGEELPAQSQNGSTSNPSDAPVSEDDWRDLVAEGAV